MQRSAGGPNAARPGTHRPERAQVLEELPVRMTPRRWDKSTGALDRRHGSRNHSHTCQPHVSTRVSQTCGLTTRRCWSVAAAKVRLRAIPGGGRPGGMGGRRGLPIPYGADRLRRCRWCSCLFEALACPPRRIIAPAPPGTSPAIGPRLSASRESVLIASSPSGGPASEAREVRGGIGLSSSPLLRSSSGNDALSSKGFALRK